MKSMLNHPGLMAGALLLATVTGQGTALANPKNVTYAVTVTTSFGTQFSDCFAFGSKGVLTVGGYGPVTYTFQGRGRNKRKFQSVSPLSTAEATGFTIQFNGFGLGSNGDGYLLANGSNEFGDSYAIQGPPSASCAAASRVAGNPYRPAAD